MGHGEASGQTDDVGKGELAEPLTLLDHLGTVPVHHLEELTQVGLGVVHHLLVGQHGAGGRLSAGVAYLRRPVADDEDDLVSQILQLAQLAEAHSMAEVDVWAAGVKPHLEAKGTA